MQDRINPAFVRNSDSGDVYELDFTRETVRFAESRGFVLEEVSRFPVTRIPELFFYAFRKNHKSVSRQKTDSILFDELKGLRPEHIERLIQLYTQPYDTLVADDGDEAKNGVSAMEL